MIFEKNVSSLICYFFAHGRKLGSFFSQMWSFFWDSVIGSRFGSVVQVLRDADELKTVIVRINGFMRSQILKSDFVALMGGLGRGSLDPCLSAWSLISRLLEI